MIILAFVAAFPVNSQGRFLKNVAKDVKGDILGSGGGNTKKTTQPEPSCACSDAQQVLGMAQNELAYNEISIDVLDDGSFLIRDRLSQQLYIIKDGVKKGPYSEEDPQVAAYTGSEESDADPMLTRYKEYISRSDNKYVVKFGGKTYGPYARINNFIVTKSGDKFAVTAVETEMATEEEGEAMDKAMKNAKTDQERMELAMKYSQQMQQKMMAGGGPGSTTPKLVTNIEGVTYNPMMGGIINADMKYDDIVYANMADIIDLKGKKLISLKQEHIGMEKTFINSTNTAYAAYRSGSLYLSDGKTLSELFNPFLVKADGKLYLAYLYYSPKKDAIMQCKLAF